jgi:exosortase D (VPLPA-CTERM-specific)
MTSGHLAPAIDRGQGRLILILSALSVLVAVLAFNASLVELVGRWIKQEEYGHGFLIAALTVWLLWSRRDALVASMGRPSWLGPLVVLAAAVTHTVGEISAIFILSHLAFIGALIGITLSIGGYSLLRVAAVPLLFLLFAIPLPYFIESLLTWRLQLISSELGVLVIRMFDIPVYLEGNVIDLGNYKVQVVEACSGLRYLYPLLGLSFLAAYFFHAPLWQRVVVFLSAVPITILMNSFRIGMVGVLVHSWGSQMADGALHFFEGWVVFLACTALLMGEIYLLARLVSGRSLLDVFGVPTVEPRPGARREQASRYAVPLQVCLVLLGASWLTIHALSGRPEIVPERTRFASFPSSIGTWQGRSSQLEPQVEHALGLDDYILSDYSAPQSGAVNLYVAYYPSQRQGVSPHSPIVCMPGGGWHITEFQRTRFGDTEVDAALPLNRAVIERNGSKQLVYYWFVQRGRNVANEFLSKWYLFADALIKNRTDGALVRVTTPIYPGDSERDADRRLQAFVKVLVPRLKGYLPSRPDPDLESVAYHRENGQS